ncbi:MAG: phosphatidate cytidylyltransferase [Firmicutes bacterium]|nr:phosphatidate cytidylyltransferase [Bacillota bacterium]
MLGKRIATAVIGALATVFLVHYGQGVFAVATLIFTVLAWHEFCNMLRKQDIKGAYLLGICIIVLIWGTAWLGNSQETLGVLVAATFMIMAKTVLAHSCFTLRDGFYTIAGVLYIGLPFAHLVLLRFIDSTVYLSTQMGQLQAGEIYFWLAMIGTWASDTFAFFTGSWLGKHKLAPAISPGKTWEGLAGGVFGSIVAVMIMGNLCNLYLTSSALLGLLIGIVAPLGDLAESALKRYAGVKDSSRLLPGHGGVLDRFDSILFTVPAVYYYIVAFGLR